MFEIATELALMLMLAAFFAGMIDAIAGGGGLIAMPALLLAGLSPIETLATNKLQSSFGAATATWAYARAGHVRPREQLGMALISACAGAAGAMVAHLMPDAMLRIVMPGVLIAVAAFFALRRGLSDQDRIQRMKPAVFAFTMVPAIAAYDGFFGPGTGSFFMTAFILLAGYGVLKATAHTKLLNFASNLGSLCVFIPAGGVLWAVGLSMAVAQTCGAMIGAKLAMRVGAGLIRPLLIVTSSAMAARLIWQNIMG
ncbi:TSUP family transporter [Pseudogemmobacter faecipullorum]|uniref:Probable membrane transporter protein n=1 Tax=Pseudogemmobacter faecipullorum TaxID=2755041 RepID=A0ABS8CH39_9RHOB|nr:TSUP family transporter [Pseudogemmobacter faecipullorum]MCB5408708.1 TSUP family transporter [Pseudogemmobacter faecipullorum]